FARTILFDRGITNWRRRCIIISVVALAVTGIALWVRHALPQLAPPRDISDLKDYARQVFETVPVKALLFPWRLVVRPFLSTDATTFALAFLPALAVLGFHYVWVTGSDVAFEEASIAASERLAQKIAAIRSGNWREAGRKLKRKRAPFELRPHGFPFVAFVWKNLISVGQGFSPRVWVTLAVSAICVCAAFGRSANTGWGVMVAAIAGMLLAWTLLLGPQFMRQDFRQDLAQVDLLKSFPLPGWQIALGEVLAPALVLAGAQWILLFLTVCLLPSSLIHGLTLWTRASIGLSLAVLLPALDLLLLQIPNAAVLLFPAWFQPGKSGPQGIEVSGQRIILMIGSLTALVIGILPAAAAFAGIFFVSSLAFSPLASAALAAFAAAAVILAEATAGMMLLGWLLGRFDSSAELNP
ncbi:MAG TPA: hypothetical protein VHH88_06030, partial [Verrucomicrobiae bacterium]|nr:hypothetical protein [Verrucomicrobiae bacterium]